MRKGALAALVSALALALAAPALSSEQRPMPRPVAAMSEAPGAVRPVARPATLAAPVQAGRAATDALALGPGTVAGPGRSLVPRARPESAAPRVAMVRAGLLSVLGGAGRQPVRGSVCGDREIRGAALPPITGALPGCGVAEPVRVTELAGVRLSQPSIMDCQTAAALKDWIEDGVRPAVGRQGGGLAGLKVAGHYVCRTRNHKAGAKVSEHGKGRAVDISALILADGSAITVAKGWDRPRRGRILRAAHSAACGPFGTVLGPEADRYHKDHFHFDTARYRSGSYCR